MLITVIHEGIVGTILLTVELSNDSDGDGLPNDYETANAVNIGGANLARLSGTTAVASSNLGGFPPGQAIDSDIFKSWLANTGDAVNQGGAPFIEVTMAQDIGVAQIRLWGNRRQGIDGEFLAGIFQAFDASDVELFNSGEVQLPPPSRDLSIAVDLGGIRRVRFTPHSRYRSYAGHCRTAIAGPTWRSWS